LSVAAACRLTTADPCHPSATSQPGMSMSRGISKSSLTVALYRSFPSPVTVMAGTTALGLSRGLRTRPIRNRPRTPRWGQGRTQPGATPSTYVEPPSRAHSQRATSCRNNGHRPHQARRQLPPDADVAPPPVADLAGARVRRRTILNGLMASIPRLHSQTQFTGGTGRRDRRTSTATTTPRWRHQRISPSSLTTATKHHVTGSDIPRPDHTVGTVVPTWLARNRCRAVARGSAGSPRVTPRST
jgi:hypothetical protein